MAITNYHNKRRFKQAVRLWIALDVLYKVAKGEKRFVMVCGQRQYEDAEDCVEPRAKRRKLNAASKEGTATKYISAHGDAAGSAQEYTKRPRRPHRKGREAGAANSPARLVVPHGTEAGAATGIQGPNRAGVAGKFAGSRQRRLARSFVNIDLHQTGSSI